MSISFFDIMKVTVDLDLKRILGSPVRSNTDYWTTCPASLKPSAPSEARGGNTQELTPKTDPEK